MATEFIVILLSLLPGTLFVPFWVHHLFTVPFRKKGNLVFIALTVLSMAVSVEGFYSDSTVLVLEKGELSLSPLIR